MQLKGWKQMEDIVPNLIFPFVYLDSSFLYRKNNAMVQKLTRKHLYKNPQNFNILLEDLIIASAADRIYYEQIINLQENNIISTLITYEALNSELAIHSPNLISLFGNITPSENIKSLSFPYYNQNLVLWDENVSVKTYNSAAMAILNSTCIVADSAFLSLSIGRRLTQYIASDSLFYILKSGNIPETFGSNAIVHELPPKKFIQILHSQLKLIV